MSAGPSRLPAETQADTQAESQTQANGTGHTGRKRKRYSNVADVFEKQSREEVTRLAAGYRDLQTKADDTKTNLANASAKDLEAQLREQHKLFRDVKDTGLATLDARFLQTTSESAIGLARRMKLDSATFDIDDFLIRIKSILGLDRLEMDEQTPSSEDELDESLEGRPGRMSRRGTLGDWEKIGWMAAGLCRRVPGIEFMYGPLAVDFTKRKIGPRQKRAALAPEVRPQQVQTQTKDGEKERDDTLSNVRRIGKLLNQKDPEGTGINFLKFVINPKDYGQTIENIFYASFLVRDGRAGIEVKPDGEILFRPTDPHEAEIHGDIPKNQAVIELDMETWEEAKRVFNITESAIPHRKYDPIPGVAPGSWYS